MSFTSPLDDSLQSLLNQLNSEFDECIKQIVPNGLDNTERSRSSQDESKANKVYLLRFLQIAKKLETALSKIIQSEKQQEQIALQDEINGLQQNIAQQREVIEKYTALVRKWSKEFNNNSATLDENSIHIDISINDLSPVSAQTIVYIFRKAIRSGQDTILHWYHFADRRIDEVSVSNKVGKKKATSLVYHEIKQLLPDITDVNLRHKILKARKIRTLFSAVGVEKISQVSYRANAISSLTYIQNPNHHKLYAVKNDVKSLPEVRILPIDKNASEKSRLPISTLPNDPEEKRNLVIHTTLEQLSLKHQ
ncbi:7787_t:CDS:2 [Gigaspora rosea]|nr:7787_t:CDS:2 [Gigaspora rosea]